MKHPTGQTYNPGQVKHIYPYLPKIPQWFILGGPADGDEAQCISRKLPGINVMAIEPCQRMIDWQLSHGFPGTMISGALSDNRGTGTIRIKAGQERCSTMVLDREGTDTEVTLYTLDQLRTDYGPFPDSVLWLDIEGMEYRALLGARDLLASGEVILINVEVRLEDVETVGKAIDDLLTGYGYVKVEHWDRQSGNHYDAIYVKVVP